MKIITCGKTFHTSMKTEEFFFSERNYFLYGCEKIVSYKKNTTQMAKIRPRYK